MTEAKKEAAIVLVKYGPVVLVVTNRRYGGLGLPGGKVEGGELPEVAGKREVEEETGLQVFTKDLVPVFRDYTVVEPDRMVHVFLARKISGSLQLNEKGTEPSFTTYLRLLQCSPFEKDYRQMWPMGIRHLKDTEFWLDT